MKKSELWFGVIVNPVIVGGTIYLGNSWDWVIALPVSEVNPKLSNCCAFRKRQTWLSLSRILASLRIWSCLGLNVYFKIENPPGHRIQKLFAGKEEVQRSQYYTAAFVTMHRSRRTQGHLCCGIRRHGSDWNKTIFSIRKEIIQWAKTKESFC